MGFAVLVSPHDNNQLTQVTWSGLSYLQEDVTRLCSLHSGPSPLFNHHQFICVTAALRLSVSSPFAACLEHNRPSAALFKQCLSHWASSAV